MRFKVKSGNSYRYTVSVASCVGTAWQTDIKNSKATNTPYLYSFLNEKYFKKLIEFRVRWLKAMKLKI